MTGDSRMKHSLLKRLAPRTNHAQLNRTLWHAVNNRNEKEFTAAQRGSTAGDLSIEGGNEERYDGILAMINSLSITDGARKVDAWCYIGTGSFSILRIGPLDV
ncbi:hypothetical protein N7523_002054 [Penicillium sp. IBT 18751x]|nr:hypothetical protein N7523_002054 [Penicillium sp. IBT 18751x]